MKIELEFSETEIGYLTNTIHQCFLSEYWFHFEVLSDDLVYEGDDPHGEFIKSFLNDYDGRGSLHWIDGKYFEAKIFADWWTKKLGKQCHILWDFRDESGAGGEFVVWVPKPLITD